MPTFIKTGLWEKVVKGYKGWLNLDDLIVSLSSSTPGPQGPVGPQGPQGVAGPQGIQGETGAALTVLGSYPDLAAFEAGAGGSPGEAGQAWLIESDGSLYIWNTATNAWEDVGDLQGPQGIQGIQGPQGEQGIQGIQGIQGVPGTSVDTTLKATLYVDPSRSGETYTRTGNILTPFNTIGAAYAAAVSAGYSDSNPAIIVLLGNTTENVTFTQGGIWLTSFGSGTHGSYNITGSITLNGSAGSTSANHFMLANIRVIAPSNGKGIYSTGTNPQKVFLKDIWVDASGTTGSGIYIDNSGSGSTLHLNDAHLTHSGTGDVYCIDARTGGCYITDIETSGSNVQVIRVGASAVVTLDSSEIDGSGDAAIEVYGGTIIVTRSVISNTKVNGHGVALNTSGSIATVGECLFNINASGVTTGKAVYGVATTLLYYQYLSFFPGSNTAKTASPTLIATQLSTSFT